MRRASAASACICATSAVEAREALLVAQLRHELHFDLAPVQVVGEIEHVRLEQRLAAPHGRTRPEARHAGPRAAADAVHTHRKDAGDRRTPALERQVGGGEPQVRAQLLPRPHPAAHRPGAPQGAFGRREVTAVERCAHGAAADALPVPEHRLLHVDLEAEASALLGEQRHGPLTVLAEAEVVTHDHDAWLELARQQLREGLPPRGYAKPRRSAAATGSPPAAWRGCASARGAR